MTLPNSANVISILFFVQIYDQMIVQHWGRLRDMNPN